MQRTYSRKSRKRSQPTQSNDNLPPAVPSTDVPDNHTHTPSRPRKRQKVFVEIVSPSRATPRVKRSDAAPFPNQSPQSIESLSPPKSSEILQRAATLPELSPGTTSGSPQTPIKAPRDLSSLFATPSFSRSPGHASRGSVIKRMLSRSRTEPSIEASSTELVNLPTDIVSRQGSSHSLPTAFRERDPTPEPPAQTPPKALPARNIRTYAGSSRSFLVALPVPGSEILNDSQQDDTEMYESYADLRTRWGVDNSEDDPRPFQDDVIMPSQMGRNASTSALTQPPLPAGMMNDLKSITELRSKGESRRFLDEVGYLFEGLDESSAIGLRRASALEVVNKLCDAEFNRRARASDFYVRTWHKFLTSRAGVSDKIFDATIAFFASLAARDPHTLMEVAQQSEFIPTLAEILGCVDHKKDVLALALANSRDSDLKSHGIPRTEILPLKSLAEVVSRDSRLSSQPSARYFVSSALAALSPAMLGVQHLPPLLASLRTELSLLEPRTTAYLSGLPLLPPPSRTSSDVPSLYHIEACLRLLDSYLLQQWSASNPDEEQIPSPGLSHADGLASELLSLCVVAAAFMRECESDEERTIARKCLCGGLRVLTLLSHGDESWCEASLKENYALPFVTLVAVQSQAKWSNSAASDDAPDAPPSTDSVEAFDLLCLALGLLMNWATLSRKVTTLCRGKSINPGCPGARPCVRACQCPDRQSVLECLSAVYIQHSSIRENDPPESSFLRGYLAVLLGLLIKDNSASQAIVMTKLSGGSQSDKIKSLITHCRTFLDLYSDTTASLSTDSPPGSPDLTHEVTDRPRASWDKRGEDIARSVIASLDTMLRNP